MDMENVKGIFEIKVKWQAQQRLERLERRVKRKQTLSKRLKA